ncbi:RNA polymerase sigma-70 factor [Leifsonia sp. NPDC058292]|uniref:RNA polymerase sigma-70 factor n=1 Tax=Leifsonia sp. NPDC058292 TaxID=3346428 RepID=UPI0036DDEDDF
MNGSTRADDESLEIFNRERRRVFGTAYRMLGSVSDAEDIVQDTWLRWQAVDPAEIEQPGAFLTTIATRLSINMLQSAHSRRETYIGPWLPEPVNTEGDPTLGAENTEALEFACLLLLEALTPTERAAYVLREALDYPYERIAEVIDSSPANARQLVSRARKHLASGRGDTVAPSESRRLLEAFIGAARTGDVEQLEQLFASDIVSYTDGNGVKLAARIPVAGRTRVAKFVSAFSSHFWTKKLIGWTTLNGQPAVTLSEDGQITTVLTVTASREGILQLLWVMSPDKLRHVAPVGA